MPNDVSIQEFIAQAQRGLFQRTFGPEFLMKQTYLQATNIFVDTYGRKVWDNMNNRTVVFNALPKTVWGPTTGWFLRTDRGSGRSRPVTETGALPTIDVSNYEKVYSAPNIVGTTLGVTVLAQFESNLEGGIGDAFQKELEGAQRDHLKEINQELLAGSAYLVSDGSTTTFVVPSSIALHFKVGDTIAGYISNSYVDTARAVESVSGGTVTVATGTAFADSDAAYIKSRAGFTSLDDICMEDGAAPGGEGARVDLYNLTTRTAGTYSAAGLCSYNAGVGRDLTLTLLDSAIQKSRENGGEPKLIVMGHDQYFKLEGLLQAQQRFMGQADYVASVGDERTYPGTKTGLVLATYMGIPILPDADCAKSVATDDTVLGSNVYILDTDYLEIAIAQPTQYVENRDFFSALAMVTRALLYTMGELRCTNVFVQCKIADLNT